MKVSLFATTYHYQFVFNQGITKPGKTPPPRPPRPNNTHLSPGGVNNGDLRSVELPRRTLELASSSVMPSSNSEGNIADLLDLNSFSASSSSTLSSFSSNSLARSLDSIDVCIKYSFLNKRMYLIFYILWLCRQFNMMGIAGKFKKLQISIPLNVLFLKTTGKNGQLIIIVFHAIS